MVTRWRDGYSQDRASVSLTTTTLARKASSARSGERSGTGEALSTNCFPASAAQRAAVSATRTGISNWHSSTSCEQMMSLCTFSSRVKVVLAPGATTMQFSPESSTVMVAIPLGPSTSTRPSRPTLLSAR
ncbi:Uncharacterised protein [Mycobacteroides abscessus subsp. abscessus]|nr:Uncharacterised protein [Mycobacteroides abscessus subsp. abscessus]